MTNLTYPRYNAVGIGLETLFSRLDALQDSTATNYPPYNIIVRDGETFDLRLPWLGGVVRTSKSQLRETSPYLHAAVVPTTVSMPTRVSPSVALPRTGNSQTTQ